MNSATLAGSLREQAIALRRSGRSRREIKAILGITSNATLNDVLAGEPPPEWTRRPRAKDDLRARARELREQGLDLARIAAELGVSKSSVSGWVCDIPLHERLSYEECRKRASEGYAGTGRPSPLPAKRSGKRSAPRARSGMAGTVTGHIPQVLAAGGDRTAEAVPSANGPTTAVSTAESAPGSVS